MSDRKIIYADQIEDILTDEIAYIMTSHSMPDEAYYALRMVQEAVHAAKPIPDEEILGRYGFEKVCEVGDLSDLETECTCSCADTKADSACPGCEEPDDGWSLSNEDRHFQVIIEAEDLEDLRCQLCEALDFTDDEDFKFMIHSGTEFEYHSDDDSFYIGGRDEE